jgi:hypothetical protein
MEQNEKQFNDKDIKVLRTYASDMAEAVKQNEMSVIKIAMAEKEKRDRENVYKEAEGTTGSKIFFVIGGIVLLVAAVIGAYYLIQQKKEKETPEPIVNVDADSFIAYDSKLNIDVTNISNADGLVNAIKESAKTNTGSVEAIFFTKNVNSIIETLTTGKFLSLISTTMPGALERSLLEKYLLGKYSGIENKTGTFLIFQTTDYNQAYASMLTWEKTMVNDLGKIFNIESSQISSNTKWKDVIVNNKDVRVLYGNTGDGLLYYVFVNNNFVITNNVDTLKEIVARLIIKNS